MRAKLISILCVCIALTLLSVSMTWAESDGWGGPKGRVWRSNTAAPAVTDDVNKGYRVLDLWYSGTSAYVCLATTAGAANWQPIDNSSGGGGGGVALGDNNVWTSTNEFDAQTEIRSAGARAGVTCFAVYDSSGVTDFALFENGIMYIRSGVTSQTHFNILSGVSLYSGVTGYGGSAAAPGFGFNATGGAMGMYKRSETDLGFSTAGTERMYISGSMVTLTNLSSLSWIYISADVQGLSLGSDGSATQSVVGSYATKRLYLRTFGKDSVSINDAGIIVGTWQSGVSPMGSGVTSFVQIASGVSPVAGTPPPVGGPQLYATGGDLWVCATDGSNTQLSPHDPQTGEWYYNSYNVFSGKGIKYYPISQEKEEYTVPKINPEEFHRSVWISGNMQEIEVDVPDALEDAQEQVDVDGPESVEYELDKSGTVKSKITKAKAKETRTVKRLKDFHRLDPKTGKVWKKIPPTAEQIAAGFKFDWSKQPLAIRQAWGK